MTTEPVHHTLAHIAAGLDGTLIDFAPMCDDPDDRRYVIAYRLRRSAWVCAIVDAGTGGYLDGVIYPTAPTLRDISAAFALIKGEPERRAAAPAAPA